MYRVSFLAAFLLLFTFTHSNAGNNMCLLLEAKKKNMDQSATRLRKKYPEITKFYGLNTFMLRGEIEDAGAFFIIQIAESISKCTKKMDPKKCDLAASEIIQLIKYGVDMCKASSNNKCDIC